MGRSARRPVSLRAVVIDRGAPRLAQRCEEQLRDAGDLAEQRQAVGADLVVVCVQEPSRERLIAVLDELRPFGGTPCLLVLGDEPSPYVARLLANRADGYLVDDAELPHRLDAALHAMAVGLTVLPPTHQRLRRPPSLTAREKQVLAMVVLDLSNGEIARKLSLTEPSVKNVLTTAYAKLGVGSRAAAAELILDTEAGLGPGILRITSAEPPS